MRTLAQCTLALLATLESERDQAVVQLTLQPVISRWVGQLYGADHKLAQVNGTERPDAKGRNPWVTFKKLSDAP